jgi:hypothetical protein
MDIFIYYVIPNVILFGGIYAITRYVEHATEYYINNYEECQKVLFNFRQRFK